MALRTSVVGILLLLVLGCGGEGTTIRVETILADGTDTSGIEFFYVVVQDTATDTFFYPQTCIGTDPSSSANDSCICSGCPGLSANESTFDPSLEDFSERVTLNVTLCGMNASQSVVISGATTVFNGDPQGETSTITMSNTDSSCAILPPLCPEGALRCDRF